jgi:hypothetical protein
MTTMSLGSAKLRGFIQQRATDGEVQTVVAAEQRTRESWDQRIAYCQKYRELLSKKDQQFVDDLAGREPTPRRIRHLKAVKAAIQRDPRSSGA